MRRITAEAPLSPSSSFSAMPSGKIAAQVLWVALANFFWDFSSFRKALIPASSATAPPEAA